MTSLFICQDLLSFRSDLLEKELVIVSIIGLIRLSSYITMKAKTLFFVTRASAEEDKKGKERRSCFCKYIILIDS